MAFQALGQRNVGPIRATLAFSVLGIGVALLLDDPLHSSTYRLGLLIFCTIFVSLVGSFTALLFPIISRSTPSPKFGSPGLQRTLRVLLALALVGVVCFLLGPICVHVDGLSIGIWIVGGGLIFVTVVVGGVLGIVLDVRRRIAAQQRRIVTNECTRGGDRVRDDG